MECQRGDCKVPAQSDRKQNVRTAKLLAAATVGWNLFEGIVALWAGYISGSVALVGFGLDSTIETISASIVGFRFWSESRGASARDNEILERRAARGVGFLLLLLAAYICVDAARKLLGFSSEAKESFLGIGLTVAALIVMPLLARAKYQSAKALGSKAMKAEAFQSLTCAWMAGATLLGLTLNALFHWTWADPAAALLIVPAVVKEGIEALKGELCTDCH
jgi:divalent metal cation (Fe/Co/Zn/Cd) transporter